jgi:hypothetical protein
MFSVQCLLLGLHGYLIHFAPLAFIPHCQIRARKVPSLSLVRMRINTFYRYSICTLYVSRSLAQAVSLARLTLEDARFHKRLTKQATDVLDPIIVAATRTAGITAAAGTSLAQSLFVCLFTAHKSFQKKKRTLACSVTLSRIAEVSRLLHPVGLGIVSQIPSQGFSAKSPY